MIKGLGILAVLIAAMGAIAEEGSEGRITVTRPELPKVRTTAGEGSKGRIMVTRPDGLHGVTETKMLTLGPVTDQQAVEQLELAGGWAQIDLLWYEPVSPAACGTDSSRECNSALEAACTAHGGEVESVEFAKGSKCSGRCTTGQSVNVSCVKP